MKRSIPVIALLLLLGLALWAVMMTSQPGPRRKTPPPPPAVSGVPPGPAPAAAPAPPAEKTVVDAQVASSDVEPDSQQATAPGENPVTATAIIARADGSRQELSAIDREFERVTLLPGESIRVQVDLADAESDEAVTLETGHGGNINGTMGLTTVMPRNGRIEFTFSAGGHRGKYPVFIYQGSRQEMLDFYVGDEPPVGKAGPVRLFTRDNS